jgi:hypothetical protein
MLAGDSLVVTGRRLLINGSVHPVHEVAVGQVFI